MKVKLYNEIERHLNRFGIYTIRMYRPSQVTKNVLEKIIRDEQKNNTEFHNALQILLDYLLYLVDNNK